MTFKGFQKSMSLSSPKVTVGTGVTLTGQGSTTPKALPLVSTNPNRAFGISSVLESLMSLALDACLLAEPGTSPKDYRSPPAIPAFPSAPPTITSSSAFLYVDSSLNSV